MNNVPRELGIAERNRVFGRMFPVFDTEILAVSRLFDDDVPTLDDAVGKRQTHVAHGRLVAVAVAHRDDVGLRPLVVDEVQFGKLEVDQASHRGIAVLRIQARREVDRTEIRLPLRSVGVSDFRRRPVLNVLGAVVCGIDRADPAKVLRIRLSENGLVRIGKGAARRYSQRRSDGKRKGMTKGGEHFSLQCQKSRRGNGGYKGYCVSREKYIRGRTDYIDFLFAKGKKIRSLKEKY